MEASASRSGRFSIVTGGPRWIPMLERLVQKLEVHQALANIRAIALTGGQIAASPDASINLLAGACQKAVDEDGACECWG